MKFDPTLSLCHSPLVTVEFHCRHLGVVLDKPYRILTLSFFMSFWQIFRSPFCDHPTVLYSLRISWSGPLLFRTHWYSCRKTPDPWWARYLVDRGCDSANNGKACTRRWKQLGAILLIIKVKARVVRSLSQLPYTNSFNPPSKEFRWNTRTADLHTSSVK